MLFRSGLLTWVTEKGRGGGEGCSGREEIALACGASPPPRTHAGSPTLNARRIFLCFSGPGPHILRYCYTHEPPSNPSHASPHNLPLMTRPSHCLSHCTPSTLSRNAHVALAFIIPITPSRPIICESCECTRSGFAFPLIPSTGNPARISKQLTPPELS